MENRLKVTGLDENGHPVILPGTMEEYYSGVPKRFAGIRKIVMQYEEPIKSDMGSIVGDFALLKAFLADHDREISVEVKGENGGIRLFFPAYLYGFVEDTFARAIHHKIEGVGYTLRECIGKYEIRIREYDRLFMRVIQTDASVAKEAGRIALSRLLYPMNLTEEHRISYNAYLKENDEEVLLEVTKEPADAPEAVAYLTENELVSRETVKKVLPSLSDTSLAPVVAMLLRYTNREDAGKADTRMSLW